MPAPCELCAADWLTLIDLAQRLDGPAAAREIWNRSPLPPRPELPEAEAAFLAACAERKAGAAVAVSDVWRRYLAWCQAQGLDALPRSRFDRAMTALGLRRIKRSTQHFTNIRLRRGVAP